MRDTSKEKLENPISPMRIEALSSLCMDNHIENHRIYSGFSYKLALQINSLNTANHTKVMMQ